MSCASHESAAAANITFIFPFFLMRAMPRQYFRAGQASTSPYTPRDGMRRHDAQCYTPPTRRATGTPMPPPAGHLRLSAAADGH